MDFSQVDKAFSEWAKENALCIFTKYKEEEVRSVEIVKSPQSKWQLWLDPCPEENKCVIHYWNYKKQHHALECTVESLKTNLQEIYSTITSNKE